MTTKIPLLFAIIALLPFGAKAETITYNNVNAPARIPTLNGDGTAVVALAAPPYATVTIENDDDEHIASTAYVKGAYNDTIAGINNLYRNKQNSIEIWDREEDDTFRLDTIVEESLDYVTERNQLVTGMAVKNALNAKRVTIYTTWDDDSANATTQVELSTAQ